MKRRSTISFAAAAALVVGLVVAPFAAAPASGASTLTSGTLAGKIYFAAGSSRLTTANKTKLLGLFAALPYASRVDLIGYAQSKGLDKSSRVLAKARATSIKRYLADQGIGDQIVVNVGTQPSASAKLTTARRVNVWVRSLYTVTYNYQTPSVSNTAVSYLQANTALTLPAPTRTGFAFLGWYTAATAGTKIVSPYVPTAPIILYAQWGTGHKVSFNANSATGTVPTALDWDPTTTGVTLPTTTTLTKTGFTFDGWSLTAGGAKLTSPYAPTADVTLYARWIVTVTYNANGATSGTAPAVATWAYGSTALTLPGAGTLAKTGYVFGGWSTTVSGTAVADPYTPTASITLYAIWGITPTLTTTSAVLPGDATATIVVTTSSLDLGMDKNDLVIDPGTTDLHNCTASASSTTEFTILCDGPASSGTFKVYARTTAFSPNSPTDTTQLSVVVPSTWIKSTTLINNGDNGKTLYFTGARFDTDIADWTTVVPGDTGLTCGTVTYVDSTDFTVTCTGYARHGTLTVTVGPKGFTPQATTSSNTFAFYVATPMIETSDSTIDNHATAVAITITGKLFRSTLTSVAAADLYQYISIVNTTGVTGCYVSDVTGGTSMTISCTGKPVTGTVRVTLREGAYSPSDTAVSNQLTFTVAAPAITVNAGLTSLASGATNPTVVIDGVGFDTTPTLTSSQVTITDNLTGTIDCAITSNTSTRITIDCVGAATGGNLQIRATGTAYDPVDGSPSNTVTVWVPTITGGSLSPASGKTTVVITGQYFDTGLTVSDFLIVRGTGLTAVDSVTATTSTSVTIVFSGTLTAGTLTIKATHQPSIRQRDTRRQTATP